MYIFIKSPLNQELKSKIRTLIMFRSMYETFGELREDLSTILTGNKKNFLSETVLFYQNNLLMAFEEQTADKSKR